MMDWKRNDNEVEIFISFAGQQRIELREKSIELNAGELVVIPRGVECRPILYGAVELLSI